MAAASSSQGPTPASFSASSQGSRRLLPRPRAGAALLVPAPASCSASFQGPAPVPISSCPRSRPAPPPPMAAAASSHPGQAGSSSQGTEGWVTVFGFSPGDTNLVLREFQKCGVIIRHHSGPRDGNWIHILYQCSYDARKALQKNGIQLSSGLIVGVKPIERVHRHQVDESFARINQGGFMVRLPSKSFALKSTGASNQLGALPHPYGPKANAGQRATSLAAPARSIVANVMDLIFGI